MPHKKRPQKAQPRRFSIPLIVGVALVAAVAIAGRRFDGGRRRQGQGDRDIFNALWRPQASSAASKLFAAR